MAVQKPKLTLVKLNQADLTKGRHVLIVESPESRRAVSLNNNVFTIGRHPQNDLMINDVLASRHHATVAWMRYAEGAKSDYSYWILDGKGKRQRSRNGIVVNGKRKSLHRLVSGDIILIGNSIKISYNYIAYTTDNSQFLNYCGNSKVHYNPTLANEKSYKETVIIDDIPAKDNMLEDSSLIEETIIKDNMLEDSSFIEETIIKE
jgi:pSer/pThr/pTyr-binding forkhead associated (FHA) protein